MRKMWTIATDDPGVCLSHSFTRFRCANTAEGIEVFLGVETLGHPRIIDSLY